MISESQLTSEVRTKTTDPTSPINAVEFPKDSGEARLPCTSEVVSRSEALQRATQHVLLRYQDEEQLLIVELARAMTGTQFGGGETQSTHYFMGQLYVMSELLNKAEIAFEELRGKIIGRRYNPKSNSELSDNYLWQNLDTFYQLEFGRGEWSESTFPTIQYSIRSWMHGQCGVEEQEFLKGVFSFFPRGTKEVKGLAFGVIHPEADTFTREYLEDLTSMRPEVLMQKDRDQVKALAGLLSKRMNEEPTWDLISKQRFHIISSSRSSLDIASLGLVCTAALPTIAGLGIGLKAVDAILYMTASAVPSLQSVLPWIGLGTLVAGFAGTCFFGVEAFFKTESRIKKYLEPQNTCLCHRTTNLLLRRPFQLEDIFLNSGLFVDEERCYPLQFSKGTFKEGSSRFVTGIRWRKEPDSTKQPGLLQPI